MSPSFPKIQGALAFFQNRNDLWLWLQNQPVTKLYIVHKHLYRLKVFIHRLTENVDEKAAR